MALRVSTGFRNKLMTPAADGGKSWAELLAGGSIRIYTGAQPADADAVESGDLLVTVRKDGASATSGTLTEGLTYQIVTFVAGDDFTNIGGTNTTGTVFVATGTTPTTWTNGSTVQEVGLSFGNAVAGKIEKPSADDWKGEAIADGTAGWFRFYDNTETDGASTSAVRFDGRVATSGGELRVVTTTIADGSNQVIANFSIEFPA